MLHISQTEIDLLKEENTAMREKLKRLEYKESVERANKRVAANPLQPDPFTTPLPAKKEEMPYVQQPTDYLKHTHHHSSVVPDGEYQDCERTELPATAGSTIGDASVECVKPAMASEEELNTVATVLEEGSLLMLAESVAASVPNLKSEDGELAPADTLPASLEVSEPVDRQIKVMFASPLVMFTATAAAAEKMCTEVDATILAAPEGNTPSASLDSTQQTVQEPCRDGVVALEMEPVLVDAAQHSEPGVSAAPPAKGPQEKTENLESSEVMVIAEPEEPKPQPGSTTDFIASKIIVEMEVYAVVESSTEMEVYVDDAKDKEEGEGGAPGGGGKVSVSMPESTAPLLLLTEHGDCKPKKEPEAAAHAPTATAPTPAPTPPLPQESPFCTSASATSPPFEVDQELIVRAKQNAARRAEVVNICEGFVQGKYQRLKCKLLVSFLSIYTMFDAQAPAWTRLPAA